MVKKKENTSVTFTRAHLSRKKYGPEGIRQPRKMRSFLRNILHWPFDNKQKNTNNNKKLLILKICGDTQIIHSTRLRNSENG